MNFSKRLIQNVLRRPKRDSETSEASITTEIKVAPEDSETATRPVETVILSTAILLDMSSETTSPVQQMEPLPIEEAASPIIMTERSLFQTTEGGEEEDDNEPPLLAPEVLIDPNLPSILNPPKGHKTPVATLNKERSSPKALRFELAQAPERTNPNYRRLSAVSSSSQWRLLPFGSLSNGGTALLRPTIPITVAAPVVQDGERAFEMHQSDQDTNRFVGTWYGSGYPAPLLLAAEISAADLKPFIDDKRPELIRDLSGEVRQIGLHAAFEGSYSNVFKGIWNGTIVSIKVIRGVGVSPSMLAKVREQREAWWKLSHPNVLSLYGFCDDFGSYGASVSPWLKNGNVGSHFKRNPIKPSQRFKLWCDVVAGLEYLHSRDPPVVHGDLKPANVMMDDNGAGVLCDFGLVHIISDEVATGMTTTTNQTGTVRYLACELVNSDDMPDPTTASDIYALGCLGLEFLFLRIPFANRRNPAQIFKDIALSVPPAPHIPFAGEPPPSVELYWKTLTQCWNPEPEQRPNAHQVLEYLGEGKAELVGVLEEDFVPAPGLILDEPETAPATRRMSSAPVYRSSGGANS